MLLLLLTLFLATPALAAETDPVQAQADAIGMDELTRQAEGYMNGWADAGEAGDFSSGAAAVLRGGGGELPGSLKGAVSGAIVLLLIVVACAMAENVSGESLKTGLEPARLAGVAAVTAVAAADVNALLSLGTQAMDQMDVFSKALLPAMTAACAANGAPVSAAARQGVTLLGFSLLMTLIRQLLIPLVYGYVAASAAHAALGNEGLKRLAGLLKSIVATLLGALLTAFVFYLTISGAVAGNADAVAQKTAKMAISGMVPVVGGILSDAADTVVAGAGVLKGTVGTLGLVAVLAICLLPFLRLGLHYLVYKCAAALAGTVSPGPLSGLIDAIGSAFALILGMVGGCALILYVALITSIKAVGG